MKNFIISAFICFIFCLTSYAQLESNIWYFGANAGISFSTSPPTALTNGMLVTGEGCATICNSNGNLLFYTDGITVYNHNHQIMDNGSSLHGNFSATQSAVIVPKPLSNTIYYIFTVDAQNVNNYGVEYSVVDISMNGGLGKVINKNIMLFQPSSEKISVARHSNNTDYWVVTHDGSSNKFFSFLVTSSGVNTTAVVSQVGAIQNLDLTVIGYLKMSNNNQKLASAKGNGSELELFDFNNSTGVVSNPILLGTNEEFYGVEFSPDNSKLYATNYLPPRILQFDLMASNIAASRVTVGNGQIVGGALQVGLDNKIYYADFNQDYLGVINNPNSFSCNFVAQGIYLAGKKSQIGLPNIIPSLIIPNNNLNAVFSISDTVICAGSYVSFTNNTLPPYTSQAWFIDGLKIDTNVNSGYVFNNPGNHFISLIVNTNAISDTAILNIQVLPTVYNTIHKAICEGDSIAVGNHYYSQSGSFNDTLTSISSCDSILTVVLSISPNPVINLGNDLSICLGDLIVLNATYPNATYLWQDNSVNPTYIVTEQGLFWVIASIDSCSSMDSIRVVTEDCEIILELPNFFSPNNDAINDVFMPSKIKGIQSLNTLIYNRWGNLIYSSDELKINWCGTTNNGGKVADGVYYWIITYVDRNGKKSGKNGSVTILR
ncbi:MAG: gliding motility-associated C-terminal domain-containing protein [Bacteroidetes bacterium]|nr:gliding motility-associated C-terminal domain-containing protein [Bacteroidota bacterium]